ncbi:MAG: ATP-binding protein [bacterium]|nr:ATP-binding protein [bacterium]
MNFAFIGAIIATLINLSLAAIILTGHRNNIVRKTFGFISICLFIWNLFRAFALYFKIHISPFAPQVSLFFRLNSIGLVFLPTAVLHFVISFTGIKEKFQKYLLLVSYSLSGFFLLTLLTPYAISTGWTYAFCFFQIPIYLYSIYLLFYKHKKSVSSVEKNRLQYVIIGAIIGIAGGLTDTFPAFGINFPALGSLANAVYALIIAYTIIQYRLFGVGGIAKNTLSFILMAAVLSAILLLFRFIPSGPLLYLFAFLSASLIILAYQPVRSGINKFVSAIGKEKNYRELLAEFNTGISNTTAPEEVFDLLLNTASKTINASRFSLALKNKNNFQILKSPKKEIIPAEDSLIKELNKNTVVVKEELIARIKFGNDAPAQKTNIENIIQTMQKLESEVAVPMKFKMEISGFLLANEKTNGNMFTKKELEFLTELCRIAILSIETYKTHAEKEKSKHLSALGTMVSSVAHEIKNPLGSVKGAAQYLETEFGKNEFIDIILTETNRLNELVSEFLEFSRPPTIKTEPYNVAQLIDKTIPLVKKDNVVFKTNYSEVPLLSIDPDLMKQVFLNLFLNAVQAMPEKGEITISVQKQKDTRFVEIKIQDNGLGIPSEVKDKIWEPFFTTKKKGSGLGLSIVRQIIDAHNGMIDIESKEKQGTTITIMLPGDKNA